MRVLILAAGISKRLQPLTNEIPKTLLPLGSKTILEHILDTARQLGLEMFDIVTGHGHKHMQKFAAAYQQKFPSTLINLIFHEKYHCTGNVASMHAAKKIFTEDFVLINSDTIFHIDILRRLINTPHKHAMMIDDHKQLGAEEMKVLVNDANHITHIHKSLDASQAKGEYIGLLKFSKSAATPLLQSLTEMIAENDSAYYEDALQKMITNHAIPVHALSTQGLPNMEIDTHEDLAKAQEMIELISPQLTKTV